MKKTDFMTMTAAMMLATSACVGPEKAAQTDGPIIGKQEVTVKDGRMTPETLWAMGRIGSSCVSPDGKRIAYTVSYYSVKENKSHLVIYVMNADGSGNQLLTTTAASEGEPAWIKNGSKLAFLAPDADGNSQIWEMNPDGSERVQLSSFAGGIDGFKFSPDESKVLFISQVKYGERTVDKYPDLDKASGMVIDDLMYKHWDEWVQTVPHPFVAPFAGNKVGEATDILAGEPYESPMKPFGGIEQLTWSPDSKCIAYTCRKKTGLEYAISTDSDIYLYNLETKQTRNLCKEDATDKNMGYDTNPQFSPDGGFIAWQSMERDGYESDRNRLCVMDLKNGKKTYVTESFQSGVDSYCWAPDNQTLYFTGVWHATSMIHRTNLKGEVEQLTEGMYDYASVEMLGDGQLLTKRHSISEADELFTVNLNKANEVTRITQENDHIFKQLKLGKVEARWTKTVDGKDMLSWVIYPVDFDPNKKYPIIEYIYSGPGDQYVPKTFTPYNWWMTSLAELGFIVVQVDGMTTSFRSKEFEEVCYKNLKDAGLPDHIAWIKAAAEKYPYMDIDRVGIFGCSAGGQESTGAVLFHPEFYKAAYSACGCHDNRMDKIWWNELWMGYPVDESYSACSNVDNAHRLTRPLMLVVGEMDDNVDPASTMQVVNALIKAGKDFDLVVIPGARHTMGEDFGEHKRYDFFVRHLLGVTPPSWDQVRTK